MKKEQPLKGKVSSIKFRNSDNWAVFSIVEGSHDSVPGSPTMFISCTGILPSIVDIGSFVECVGVWEQTKYGKQLKCDQVIPEPPDVDSDAGVIALLRRLPGIGLVKATKAVQAYGYKKAWKAACECPSVLGISDYGNALKAQQKALSMSGDFTATVYLLGLGLTDYQCNKIIMKYGADNAVSVVSENPYQLIDDIDGFGFLTVDKIALKAGMNLDSDARIMACVMFCLLSSEVNGGNVWMWGKELVNIVKSELAKAAAACRVSLKRIAKQGKSIDYDAVRHCVYNLQHEGLIHIEGGKVYSKRLLDAEKVIAGTLRETNKP